MSAGVDQVASEPRPAHVLAHFGLNGHQPALLVRREQSRPRPAPTPDAVTVRLRSAPDPEDEAHRALLADRVRGLVHELDDPKRLVIVMSYYLGYTQAEIAAATGVPLGTVKTRTRDALRQLRVTAGSRPGSGEGEAVASAA